MASLMKEQLETDAKNLDQLTSPTPPSETDEQRLTRLSAYLDTLFSTAHDPQLSTIHKVKAYNTLCGLVDICLKSDSKVLKSLLSQDVCQGLLDSYIEFFDGAKAKALKQVSNTLLALLQDGTDRDALRLRKDHVLSRLLDAIFRLPNQKKAKPSLIILSACFSKDIFGPDDLKEVSQEGTRPQGGASELYSGLSVLLEELFSWLSFPGIAPAAATFAETLLRKLQPQSSAQVESSEILWTRPLMKYVVNHNGDITAVRNYLMPHLLKLGSSQYWKLLQQLGIDRYLYCKPLTASQDGRLLPLSFALLQVGVEHGLVLVTDSDRKPEITLDNERIKIPARLLSRSILADSSYEARLAGLSLLVSSPSTKRPVGRDALDSIRHHLRQLFSDIDPWFRMETLSLFERLIERLKVCTAAFWKSKQGGNLRLDISTLGERAAFSQQVGSAVAPTAAREHIDFLHWLYWFLIYELHPSASYQRRITSIKSLLILARSGLDPNIPTSLQSKKTQVTALWPVSLHVINSESRRIIYDLLLDPFDDVRQNAQSIIEFLSRYPAIAATDSQTEATESHEHIGRFIEKADRRMLESGRLDHADGVARAFCVQARNQQNRNMAAQAVVAGLIKSIEISLDIAESDIHRAVNAHPVHGYFMSLRYIVASQNSTASASPGHKSLLAVVISFIDSIVKSTDRCWDIVRSILCNDAPEGFNIDDSDEDHTTNTKDLLSYAWRALKDSDLLLRKLLEVLHERKNAESVDSDQLHSLLLSVGKACFSQLAQLRHRGAFSTVAQTFTTVCTFCERSKNDATRDLLEQWYLQAIALIRRLGNAVTRRSAGIPALVVGVLAANPWNDLFPKAVSLLEEISLAPATNEEITMADFPQVHALNTLRSIFTTSKLSERSEKHVTTSIGVATTCLSSETWAIRNCGLMLLRSLIDRLLGCHESTEEAFSVSIVQSKLAYAKYPGLLRLLEAILKGSGLNPSSDSANPAIVDEAVFPVLDILRRAPPPHSGGINFQLLLLKIVSRPQWHLRELAARAFVSCLKDTEQGVNLLTQAFESASTQNGLHGLLLCLKNLCRYSKAPENTLGKADKLRLVELLATVQKSAVDSNSDPFTIAVFFEAMNELGHSAFDQGSTARPVRDSYLQTSYCAHSALGVSFQHMPLQSRAVLANRILLNTTQQAEVNDLSKSGHAELHSYSEDIIPEAFEVSWSILVNSSLPIQLEFARTLCSVWLSARSTRLRHSTAKTLADVCDSLQGNIRDTVFERQLSQISSILSLEQGQISENLMRLQGRCIAAELRQTGVSTSLSATIRRWNALLRTGLDEYNEYPLRYAAALSLAGFRDGFDCVEKLPTALCQEICFTIYDILNDDDEDIREVGSIIAAAFLSCASVGVRMVKKPVPMVAAQALATHLCRAYPSSAAVIAEALRRVTGQAFATGARIICFSTLLNAELQNAETLFAVERQNLYVDDAEEARDWSSILQTMNPRELSRSQLDGFLQWVTSGLDVLTAAARDQQDGLMGWTTKPSAFILGFRLIRSMAVLLAWRSITARVDAKWSELVQKLETLAEAGRSNGMHDLWLREIGLVLSKTIQARLSRVAGGLSTVL